MTVDTEATDDPLELELVTALGTPRAWAMKVVSRRLNRVLWLAGDAASAAALIEGDRELPVIFKDELEEYAALARLRDGDDRLHARLDALAASRMR
jgi:hypothetical protein